MSPLFANLDATGWSVIIAAIFLGAGQILGMILAYRREQDKIAREERAAERAREDAKKIAEKVDIVAVKVETVAEKTAENVAAVKDDLKKNTDETIKTGDKLEAFVKLSDSMIELTGREAFQRGLPPRLGPQLAPRGGARRPSIQCRIRP